MWLFGKVKLCCVLSLKKSAENLHNTFANLSLPLANLSQSVLPLENSDSDFQLFES